jgi:hypothetical protein
MKKWFLAASGIFSTIPGLTIIASGLGVPPGYKVLFGGVMEAFGVLSLLILWVNRTKIRKTSKASISRWATALGLLCFLFISAYIVAYSYCVVTSGEREPVYYPLWLSGEAATKIAQRGGRLGAIEYYGSGGAQAIVDKMPGVALPLTTVLLLFLYQGVFTSLALTFGLLGVHERFAFTSQADRPPNTPHGGGSASQPDNSASG